jgi:hypothetical protein
MKNPLKKLSGSKRADRREALEQEAAEKIRQASSQAPPEASSAAWAHPAAEAPVFEAAPSAPLTAHAPAGRRLTVQERLAARQSA